MHRDGTDVSSSKIYDLKLGYKYFTLNADLKIVFFFKPENLFYKKTPYINAYCVTTRAVTVTRK